MNGYQLVPTEPTDAMLEAGTLRDTCPGSPSYGSLWIAHDEARNVWRAMLAAVPPHAVAAVSASDTQADRDRRLGVYRAPKRTGAPRIERSQIDGRWCVYTNRTEALCPAWAVPIVWLYAWFA